MWITRRVNEQGKNGYVDNNNDASKLLDISYLVSYSFGKRSASLSNDMYPKYATA